MATPTVYVETPPVRIPRLGGIQNVVSFLDAERLGVAGYVEWVNESCEFSHPAPGLCWGTNPGGTKDEIDGITIGQSGPVFAAYHGVECFLGGDDFDARAERGLLGTENQFIEGVIAALTPTVVAGGSTLGESIAAADNWADANYPGRPIIWVNRGDAVTLAAGDFLFQDGLGGLWTANGSPVVASAQFPEGTVWVSGQATVYRSPIVTSHGQARETNREMAISERIYAVAFDCVSPTEFTTA